MLRIYWSPLSSPANKVRHCANALELAYETVTVNLREGEHRTPEYRTIHPFGKVPAIDDDGYRLFESNAIIKYLCRKHESALYPTEIQSQGRVDAWCDFVASLFVPAFGRIYFNRVLAPMLGLAVSEKSLSDGLRFVGGYLPVIEQRLATAPYIAGETMTIADLALLNALDPSEVSEIDLSPYPKMGEWRAALRAQDFYRSVHAYFGEGILPPASS